MASKIESESTVGGASVRVEMKANTGKYRQRAAVSSTGDIGLGLVFGAAVRKKDRRGDPFNTSVSLLATTYFAAAYRLPTASQSTTLKNAET